MNTTAFHDAAANMAADLAQRYTDTGDTTWAHAANAWLLFLGDLDRESLTTAQYLTSYAIKEGAWA